MRSIVHALRGMRHAGSTERNFQLEIVAAVLIVMLMLLLPVANQERIMLLFVIVGVLVLELINTSIERVVDMLKPRVHPYARIAKDVMAAAVLISAIGAIVIGFSILFPYLYRLF